MTKLRTCAVAVLATLFCAQLAAAQVAPTNDPLYMHMTAIPDPGHAAILDGGGQKYSAYEVYVTNFGRTPITISELRVAVRASGKTTTLQTASGKDLAAMFTLLGQDPFKPQQPKLQPAQTGVFFIFAKLPADSATPDSFETAIRMESSGEHSGSGTIHAPSIAVSAAPPIVIQPPLRGNNWLAANGPSNISPHRRAILPAGGEPHIGQRYAIDWLQLGADGKSYTGDEHVNSSYHAYDQEIHAVADGKIVEVLDNVAENVPNSGKLAIVINQYNLPGNHIIEDVGGGHFAAYAHLKPGTLKVKNGDTVHAGDVIAHLGNTGNSSEPHLHFQICTAPSFFNSEGLPFALDKYSHQGSASLADNKITAIKAPQDMKLQEPMENELDAF